MRAQTSSLIAVHAGRQNLQGANARQRTSLLHSFDKILLLQQTLKGASHDIDLIHGALDLSMATNAPTNKPAA